VTAGSHDLLPNVPGPGRFQVWSWQSFPGRRWRRRRLVRRTGGPLARVRLRAAVVGAAGWPAPFRGERTPRPAGGADPAPSRGPKRPAPVVAQPAKGWTVERPARRTGATRRGPRPPEATWGHAQAHQADTSQRPGASRSGLLLVTSHRGWNARRVRTGLRLVLQPQPEDNSPWPTWIVALQLPRLPRMVQGWRGDAPGRLPAGRVDTAACDWAVCAWSPGSASARGW
jgi:hypothetical protein